MNKNLITLIIILTLAACGSDTGSSNNPATFSGVNSANIDNTTTSYNNSIIVNDKDQGESELISQNGTSTTYGTFYITSDGKWTYLLDMTNTDVSSLSSNSTLTDTITITSIDGTTSTITITITGGSNQTNTPAVITEINTTITNIQSGEIEGDVNVSDEDGENEESLIPQTDTATTYGTFSIDSNGAWTYELDTSNDLVSGLSSASETITDTIAITTIDGTVGNIIITITGIDAATIDPTPVSGADTVPDINCTQTVSSISALEAAAEDLVAGDTLCLADGTYSGDLELYIEGIGTATNPITVAAETPGNAIINTGEMSIRLGGQYIVVQGLVLRDGESGSSIIKFEKETECNYCRVTGVSIIDMDDGDYSSSKWIEFYGHHNRVDHSWFSGKESRGALLVFGRWTSEEDFNANGFPADYGQIDHNYFGDRPPAWGRAYAESDDNEYEGIRIGLSTTHSAPSYTIVENNYFERIQGEAEIISNKSANNIIRQNTIRDSNGSVVNRHGAEVTISNNFIFGDDNPYSGGIRIVDDGHIITNNYIEGTRFISSNWNGGIVLTTGDGSGDTDNGYQDVKNVLVANNTIVDSVNSININGGKNSQAPENIYFVNNVVDDAIGAVIRTNGENMPSNSVYSGNYIFGHDFSDNDEVIEGNTTGFDFVDAMLEKASDDLYREGSNSPDLTANTTSDIGNFTFPTIDMDGQTRSDTTSSGADEVLTSSTTLTPLSSSDVGPRKYRPTPGKVYVEKVNISNHDFDSGDLTGWINNNTTGAVITTGGDVFSRGNSLKLDSNATNISQTVIVTSNTNYNLSAFMKGAAKLSVKVDGQTYATERASDNYGFSSVSFNSGAGKSAVITVSVDDFITNKANILNPNFDDAQDNWLVVEGTGIGQVQDSDNSTTSSNGSIKFKYDLTKGDNGTPHDPYIAQTISVNANTQYTFSIYQLLKSSHSGSIIRFGVFSESDDITLSDATILAEKDSVYANLVAAGNDEADDDFFQDTLTIETGSNTSLTIFAQFKSTTGDEIRVDQFEISYQGEPEEGTEAFFDNIRLVSHPLSPTDSESAEND